MDSRNEKHIVLYIFCLSVYFENTRMRTEDAGAQTLPRQSFFHSHGEKTQHCHILENVAFGATPQSIKHEDVILDVPCLNICFHPFK